METTKHEANQAGPMVDQDLDIEMVPGTELLTNTTLVDRFHDHNGKDGPILIPQPSRALDDPLVRCVVFNVWQAQSVLTDSIELEPLVEEPHHGQSMHLRSLEYHAQSVYLSLDADL